MRSTHVDQPIKAEDFVDAREASELLGIKLQTLYAYASRGLIASVAGASGRARLYARADLERLRTRTSSGVRAEPTLAAAAGARWTGGDVTVDTSLTLVTAAGPHYRGQAAVALAEQGVSFEAASELLWGGGLPAAGTTPVWPRPAFDAAKLGALVPSDAPPVASLLLLVPALAAGDSERFAAPRDADIARARLLLTTLGAALAPAEAAAPAAARPAAKKAAAARGKAPRSKARPATGLAAGLAAALGAPVEAAALIDQALVLAADDELDAPVFTARVAAGAGADLYACLAAALAVASGPQHGGACDRVEALVEAIGKPERARAVVTERVRRGEPLAGFGHPLYPAGDPRAALLLAGVDRLPGKPPGLRSLQALIKAMADTDRGLPTLDTALVALCLGLGARPGTASALRALGRSAGWVAHVLEQRDSAQPLRGRGRYVGPPASTP